MVENLGFPTRFPIIIWITSPVLLSPYEGGRVAENSMRRFVAVPPKLVRIVYQKGVAPQPRTTSI